MNVALIPASTVAIILLSATAFDAITDLVFGIITDMTKSDFGRRRPYILIGSIMWCGTFLALFQSPSPLGLSQRVAYYVCALLLAKGVNTICTVPYYGLISEITPSYTERTKLSGMRLLFSLSAAMVISFCWALITMAFPLPGDTSQPNQQLGYSIASLMFVPVIIIPAIVVFTGLKEPKQPSASRSLPQQDWRSLIKSIFTNKPFVCVLLTYLLIYSCINFVQNNLLLWVTYVLEAPHQFQWLVLILQACTMISVVIWIPISNRIGKKNCYLAAVLPVILVMAANWWITPELSFLAYPMAAIGGLCIGALMLMPWSMMADCIDIDELNTGRRREGIYFACFVLFQKFALAVALAASN